MKLLQLLSIIFVFDGAHGKRNKPSGPKPIQVYRKCRARSCRDECNGAAGKITTDCTNCLQLNGCVMPKHMAKITKCAQNECKESCANGLRKPDCKECRKSGVCQIKKPAGKTTIREPINQLRKFIIGSNGKQVRIGNGTKAQLRCALGMCSAQCLLKHSEEISKECQKCVEKYCPIADAKNSTCVSVEKGHDPQFNFCSTVFECFDGGVLSSASWIEDLTCPENSYCCTWDETEQ